MRNNKKRVSKTKYNKKGRSFQDARSANSRPMGTPTNSPDWYMLTPELGRLATAVNMLTPNGLKVRFANGVDLDDSSIVIDREPGIAVNVQALIPGGVSSTPTSDLNEACRAMFVHIRKTIMKNITRYEKSDLFKMEYAVANIYALVKYEELLIQVVNKYEVLNRYTPRDLIVAMGFDPDDADLFGLQLKYHIIRFKEQIKNLVVPHIPLFDEVMDTFSHIYLDEDISKAQYILNVPDYFWRFTVNADTGKGELVPEKFWDPNSLKTYNDLVAYEELLVSELLNDEDYSFMSGDILAAYPNQIASLSKEVIDTPVEFVYSKEFLEKWHNSVQFGYSANDARWLDWKMVEESSTTLDPYLVFDPVFKCNSASEFTATRRGCGNRFLDFYDRAVTPDQIMNATRWMYSLKIHDESTYKYKLRSIGSQMCTNIYLYYHDSSGQLVKSQFQGYIGIRATDTANRWSLVTAALNDLILLSKWNYSPLVIWMLLGGSASDPDKYIGVTGDLGNYTVIEPQVLNNMNSLANYTLLGVQPLLQG